MDSTGEPSSQKDQRGNDKISFTVEVDPEIAAALEKLQAEYGARSKGSVVETLLMDLIQGENA